MIQYFKKFPNLLAVFTERDDNGLSKSPFDSLNLGLNTGDDHETVLLNRYSLFKDLSIDETELVFGNQVHGDHVEIVKEAGIIDSCDGLVTNCKNLNLIIQVADCACIYFYDPVKNVIAIIHSGWRGTLKSIAAKTVDLMINKFQCEAKNIHSQVSPCISKEKLEIGKELARDFPENYIHWMSDNKFRYDMKRHIFDQLSEKGIVNIVLDKNCTFKNKIKFFSYRRDKENSGRMMGIIRLN